MVNINISNQSPQLDKSQMQLESGSIQEIDDDNRPASQEHKVYHFHNCRIVYLDSFNTRTLTMENCGNKVPQVTICSSFFLLFLS